MDDPPYGRLDEWDGAGISLTPLIRSLASLPVRCMSFDKFSSVNLYYVRLTYSSSGAFGKQGDIFGVIATFISISRSLSVESHGRQQKFLFNAGRI
jgi:hypothetical protein